MEIKELSTNYDQIRIQDGTDRFDPFSEEGGSYTLKNSYIGGMHASRTGGIDNSSFTRARSFFNKHTTAAGV